MLSKLDHVTIELQFQISIILHPQTILEQNFVKKMFKTGLNHLVEIFLEII